MKKTTCLFLMFLLFLLLCACGSNPPAEAGTFENSLGIDGEWYAAPITELSYISGTAGDNCIAFSLSSEDATIYPDGRFVRGETEMYLSSFYPSKDCGLFYAIGENGPIGILSIVEGGTTRLYLPQFIGRFLISGGEMTPYSSGEEVGWEIEKIEYKIVGSTLYLLRDGIYMPCEVRFYGEDLFFCILNIDPLTSSEGDDLGRPGYCFVRTSAIK